MDDRATRAALLGQLALRRWRSYELVKEMRRNFRYFWPRAESRIYATLKRLESAGEATQEVVQTGARSTSVWSISEPGRAEFEAWLREAPEPTQLDCAALVRLLLAPAPDHAAVRAAVAHIRAEAEDLLGTGRRIGGEYAAGVAPFQEHVRTRALVHDFLVSWATARLAWADRADALLDQMAACSPEEGRALAVAHIRERMS